MPWAFSHEKNMKKQTKKAIKCLHNPLILRNFIPVNKNGG